MSSIRERVFYKIRNRDVELAENFAVRCPEVESVPELNMFFHQILSQYPTDTTAQRECMDDTMALEDWLLHFEQEVLPFLIINRFPPLTGRRPISPYSQPVSYS